MNHPFPRAMLRLVLAVAVALPFCTVHAAPLDDLRRQVEASQFEQAYSTGQANPQLIGDVHFDFLYGVAAINVGRVAEGLLALERHLAAVPANDRARLELARGYFLLGDYTRARKEFEFVLRYDPPAGVRANINGFLQAMQVRESADRRATARFYAEAGLGHDNNVNGGTYQNELQLSFGSVSLVDSPSQQVGDSYALAAIGGQQLMRVTNRLSVFAGADIDHRANFRQKDYDLTTAGVYAGFSQLAAGGLWRATVGTSQLQVAGDRYRTTLALSGEANYTLGQDLSLLAFAQYGESRHAQKDRVRDAASTTVGAMLTYAWGDLPWAPSAGARLSFTNEANLRQRDDLGRHVPLLRLFAAVTPAERWRVAAGLTLFTQKFGGEDVGGFESVRSDTAASVDVVVNYAIDAQWSLRLDAVAATNRSNQDLYDSRRRAASLKLRYQY